MATRLLVSVAHPDDETFGCGSLLLQAADAGVETFVLCATRGEVGESRIATDDLGALREAELRAAAALMGVREVRVLDHRDSGLDGDVEPGTLCAADPDLVAAEVRAVIEELRPDVVVTLDSSDGHRDHRVMRDATLAAIDAADHRAAAAYLACLVRSSAQAWADHVRAQGSPHDVYLEISDLGTPDEEITLILDVAAYRPRRWEVIRAHASQISPFEGLPPELEARFLDVDHLKLVRGTDELRSLLPAASMGG